MRKSISLFIMLLITALSVDMYASTLAVNVENNTKDKDLELIIQPKTSSSEGLVYALSPGENKLENVSLDFPARWTITVISPENKRISWQLKNRPLITGKGTERPSDTSGTSPIFKNDSIEYDITSDDLKTGGTASFKLKLKDEEKL